MEHIGTKSKSLLKYMAIESIANGRYDSITDVWSYGVLLWEIFSLGEVPYPDIEVDETFDDKLKKGYRMSQPLLCPDIIYDNIILECWRRNRNQRISFEDISSELRILNTLPHLRPKHEQ